MGLETLQLTNLDEIDMALGKLKTIFHQDSANWVKVDFSHWGNDPKVREKFENIKAAIMNQQKIAYDYYGSEGKMSRRVVWPHQLLFKDRAWYLIGYCEKREDFRTFKIVRMNDLRVLEEKFIPKELPAYERSVGGSSHKSVILYKLFISKEMAYRVFEEMGGEIREESDQGYYIDYPMEEDESVYDYFLSFGEFLEVLEPEEAREKMIHKIKLLANKYSC